MPLNRMMFMKSLTKKSVSITEWKLTQQKSPNDTPETKLKTEKSLNRAS